MLKLSAAFRAAARWSLVVSAAGFMIGMGAAQAKWNEPWKSEDRALVIDAYEFNPINWPEMTSDERIAAFINKASDGLPPQWSCRGLDGDDRRLCQNRWWKYSVTQELYNTRREIAKMMGLKWGAYHLGRPGNPREQADHFVDFAKPEPDELIAIDIEDNDPEKWMSLAEAEIFADQIFIRLGRYPVLYTNGNTAEYISRNAAKYPLLSRLPLWYARYRNDITGMFPEETWPEYALWQFASMHNCNRRSCPYRVKGTQTDIDVNVSPLTVAELKEAWPFDDLIGDAPPPPARDAQEMLIAEGKLDTSEVGSILPGGANARKQAEARDMLLAAYGPDGAPERALDPLALLTEVARQEHGAQARQPALSALTSSPRVDPDMPAETPRRHQPMRTHDVSAGMVDALGQMKEQAGDFAAILRPAREPIVIDAAPARAPGERHHEAAARDEETTARSAIADQLRRWTGRIMGEAQAEEGRPEASLQVPEERTGRFASAHQRIDGAFSLTR